MDGTLLRDTTASLEISRRLGRVEPMTVLEHRYAGGEIDETAFAAGIHTLWHDLTPQIVAEVVDGAPWIGGIREVCADIAARGETSMLITMSPAFFARHLHRRGVDVVHGARHPEPPLHGEPPAGIALLPADKVRLTEAARADRGLPAGRCVAYGDSGSDGPLFTHLEHTVAVNASPAIEALARVAYRGDDLREAYARGRALLDGSGLDRLRA